MQYVILVSYILLFSTGFAGLAALVFVQFRVRNPGLPFLIALHAVFLFALAVTALVFYRGNVLGRLRGAGGGFDYLDGVASLAGAALYVLLWLLLRALGAGERRDAFLRRIASVAALVAAAANFAELLLSAASRQVPGISPEPGGGSGLISYALFAIAILLAGLVLSRSRFEAEHSSVRFLLRGFGALLIGFVPLTVLEALFDAVAWQPYKPLSSDYVFFLGWNILSLAALARLLQRPVDSFVIESIPEEFIAAHGITPRERQMIVLIARGLANKEIGAELGISETTVRTHIYNLFQKVGARTRIELLRKVHS